MNTNVENNKNWRACPKCGEPVLLDPDSGKAEPCPNCASLASKGAGALGMGLLIAGIALVVALTYVCIRILL